MNVIVTGPESSGTRFVARWLEAHPDVVARHWSMPAGEQWMRHWPTDHDFDADDADAIIFVIRSFEATVASQKARELVTCRAEAEANIVQAHLRAFAWAASHGIRLCPVIYDSIVADPQQFELVFRWLGYEPQPCPEPIIDANAKWLG